MWESVKEMVKFNANLHDQVYLQRMWEIQRAFFII